MIDAREDIIPFRRAQLQAIVTFDYELVDAWEIGGGLIEVEFRHKGQIMQAGFAYLRTDGHQVASIETIPNGRVDKMPWAKPGERATLYRARVMSADKSKLKQIEAERDFDELTMLTPPGIDPRDYPRQARGWARAVAREQAGIPQPVEIIPVLKRMEESEVTT